MTNNVIMPDEMIEVPVYFLRKSRVILDGDLYKFFNYSSISSFRKMLKELENSEAFYGFFRLNCFEKYVVKAQNPSVSWLNTSAQAFAFNARFIQAISTLLANERHSQA